MPKSIDLITIFRDFYGKIKRKRKLTFLTISIGACEVC